MVQKVFDEHKNKRISMKWEQMMYDSAVIETE